MPSFLRANYRLTMDTPEDYKLMNRIYSDLKITLEVQTTFISSILLYDSEF